MITVAINDVIQERIRQQREEGWTIEHDDNHDRGEMAQAAAAYALHAVAFQHADEKTYQIKAHHPVWPWSRKWWKPKNSRRDLVRAGALIIAEIERLDRRDI